MSFDKIILGAGLYGLYSAVLSAKQGDRVLVLEHDDAPFMRATYINQARVHMGYHYPRSLSTAVKSRAYFDRFNEDFGFCVRRDFDQIYATSSSFSWTNADQFHKFCRSADIRCDNIDLNKYFKPDMCDGAFKTTEYTYDAQILKDHLLSEIDKYPGIRIQYNAKLESIQKLADSFVVELQTGEVYESGFILNATYASVNQIHGLLGFEPFKIKYELCEIILCKVSDELKNIGITVMDGPFFSIMPFGKTGLHSLTSVTFTPHITSFSSVPTFDCQKQSGGTCSPSQLGNCDSCPAKPQTAWPYMSNLARKYIREEYKFEYVGSMFSIKPILKTSEIDDSRPTVIRHCSEHPTFISVLSGKINTVYDLDEVIKS
jgi:hypothetical protein